jgi:mRNA interferase RelE/StbE
MYRVLATRRAQKDFNRLTPRIAGQVRRKIEQLAENPRPQDVKKVISLPGLLRVDSGEYRILYAVNESERTVVIERIRHRREAYR